MYDLPSSEDIEEVVINEEVISKREQPLLVYANQQQAS
jgi:ATP-dependent Clp protease ATP-binding subunit ClpX